LRKAAETPRLFPPPRFPQTSLFGKSPPLITFSFDVTSPTPLFRPRSLGSQLPPPLSPTFLLCLVPQITRAFQSKLFELHRSKSVKPSPPGLSPYRGGLISSFLIGASRRSGVFLAALQVVFFVLFRRSPQTKG